MTPWYTTLVETAVAAELRISGESASSERGSEIVETGADVEAQLKNSSYQFNPPSKVIAKPASWWYQVQTDTPPQRYQLWSDGAADKEAIKQYLVALSAPPDIVYTTYRVFSQADLGGRIADRVLSAALATTRRTRRSRLTQHRAVRAIYGALRGGRYRGVVVTDIKKFDRTIDRRIALDKVERLLSVSGLGKGIQATVLFALESWGEHSEQVYKSLDPQHPTGRGFLSGIRLINWLTWALSLDLRKKWRKKGYEVFWVGEDVLLLSDDTPTADDYTRLEADVLSDLGQELHDLGEREEQVEEYKLEIAIAFAEKRQPLVTPFDFRPHYGDLHDGFRFVGFEFQLIRVTGVRIRISQRTFQRLVWAVKRATDGNLGETNRLQRTAKRLAFMLGTKDDPESAKLRFLLSCWHNREITLQVRALDRHLGRRIWYAGEFSSRTSLDVDYALSFLLANTEVRINSFSELLSFCHSRRLSRNTATDGT